MELSIRTPALQLLVDNTNNDSKNLIHIKQLRNYLTVLLLLVVAEAHAQSGQWVWLKGDSTANSEGNLDLMNFGVFDSTYEPRAVDHPCNWTDKHGHFWMFGGYSYIPYNYFQVNCLWQFNPNTLEWALMKSSNQGNSLGNFGTQGVSSPDNIPPSRSGAMSWTDTAGNLWMFGGGWHDISEWHDFNDLWKYDIQSNEWTWVKGSNQFDQLGTYGTKGVEDINNTPGARNFAVTWTDNINNLWLFGGEAHQGNGYFNDLWKYNISSNEWTWVNGYNGFVYGFDFFQNYSYGTLGIPDSSNMPTARSAAVGWQADNGDFYLFGGHFDYVFFGHDFLFNDLWQYSRISNQWTWINGDSIPDKLGESGSYCEFSELFDPEARMECTPWIDNHGKFWLMGGSVIRDEQNFIYSTSTSDVWNHDPLSKNWMKAYKDSLPTDGYYGQKGIYSSYNGPKSRRGAIAWVDSINNFWLFGGNNSYDQMLNDLWKFTLDTSCSSNIYTFIKSIDDPILSIYPNPATDLLTIRTTDENILPASFSIFDELGRNVSNGNIDGRQHLVPITQLPYGIYVIRIVIEQKILVRKFIKA